MKQLIHAILGLLLAVLSGPPSAMATPSPAVVSTDSLVAANASSFFVLRSIAIHPGSYYQKIHRLEFVEISIADGSIRNICPIQDLLLTQDAETPDADWETAEEINHPCDMPRLLAKAGINIPGTLPLDPSSAPMELTNGGIVVPHGNGTPATRLLDWRAIDTHARAMGQIANIAWVWQPGTGETHCPYCEASTGLPPQEACTLKPQAFRSPPAPWVFAQLTCWPGSEDMPGATFFVPIPQSSYDKALSK